MRDFWLRPVLSRTICGTILWYYLPEGTVGYPAHPRSICPSVRPSVRLSVRHITFNYFAENLLIPTIKATIETSW